MPFARGPFVKPWLQRSHPNFAMIFVCTLLFHGWSAITLFSDDDAMSSPALVKALDFVAQDTWGWWHAVVAVVMLVGLFRPRFDLARLGLAIGLALMATRSILLIQAALDGIPVGIGIGAFLLITALHASQAFEPPVNPATRR